MISLFFVVAALIEFAIVLLLQRKLDKLSGQATKKVKIGNEVKPEKCFQLANLKEKDGSEETCSKSHKNTIRISTNSIDFFASILFMSSYILFNLSYWMQ